MATYENCTYDAGDIDAADKSAAARKNYTLYIKQESPTTFAIDKNIIDLNNTHEKTAELAIDIKYEVVTVKRESLDYTTTQMENESVTETQTLSKYEKLFRLLGQAVHRCDICQWSSSSGLELVAHRNSHTRDSYYTCLMCYNRKRKSYSCKRELRQHIRMDHLTLNHEWRTHVSVTEKLYECDICHKRFRNRSNFTVHKRVHSGEKPYKCDICLKQFAYSSVLREHRFIHSGEKPYECNICYKRYKRNSNLVSHKRIHSGEKPYECDICQKRFMQRAYLVSHKRVHSGEKPYECDRCQKRFAQGSNLVKHIIIHS